MNKVDEHLDKAMDIVHDYNYHSHDLDLLIELAKGLHDDDNEILYVINKFRNRERLKEELAVFYSSLEDVNSHENILNALHYAECNLDTLVESDYELLDKKLNGVDLNDDEQCIYDETFMSIDFLVDNSKDIISQLNLTGNYKVFRKLVDFYKKLLGARKSLRERFSFFKDEIPLNSDWLENVRI